MLPNDWVCLLWVALGEYCDQTITNIGTMPHPPPRYNYVTLPAIDNDLANLDSNGAIAHYQQLANKQ